MPEIWTLAKLRDTTPLVIRVQLPGQWGVTGVQVVKDDLMRVLRSEQVTHVRVDYQASTSKYGNNQSITILDTFCKEAT